MIPSEPFCPEVPESPWTPWDPTVPDHPLKPEAPDQVPLNPLRPLYPDFPLNPLEPMAPIEMDDRMTSFTTELSRLAIFYVLFFREICIIRGNPNPEPCMKNVILSKTSRNPEIRGRYAAIVDDDLHDQLDQYPWTAKLLEHRRSRYAYRNRVVAPGSGPGSRAIQYMHRLVLDLLGIEVPEGSQVDHINHDGLDNRACNLRVVTRQEQDRNRPKVRTNKYGMPCTSKYRGVHWAKDRLAWRATIRIDGKLTRLGTFSCEEEAARAWNEYAKEHDPDHYVFNDLHG
jgi:hypothetical protein